MIYQASSLHIIIAPPLQPALHNSPCPAAEVHRGHTPFRTAQTCVPLSGFPLSVTCHASQWWSRAARSQIKGEVIVCRRPYARVWVRTCVWRLEPKKNYKSDFKYSYRCCHKSFCIMANTCCLPFLILSPETDNNSMTSWKSSKVKLNCSFAVRVRYVTESILK